MPFWSVKEELPEEVVLVLVDEVVAAGDDATVLDAGVSASAVVVVASAEEVGLVSLEPEDPVL